MTAEQRVRLVWPQAVREVRGGIVSPGIWSDPDSMADFLGETWEEVSTFDRVVKAHERYIRELSEPVDLSYKALGYRRDVDGELLPPKTQNPHNAPLPEVLRKLKSEKDLSKPLHLSTTVEESPEPQSALCNCDLLSNEHEVCEHELLFSWTAAQKACEDDYHQAYVETERKLRKSNSRIKELEAERKILLESETHRKELISSFAKQSSDLIMAKADIALLNNLLVRLVNAKRLRDAKNIDDGDFLGFAEETVDEYLEMKEAK